MKKREKRDQHGLSKIVGVLCKILHCSSQRQGEYSIQKTHIRPYFLSGAEIIFSRTANYI